MTTETTGVEADAAPGRRSFVDTWTEVIADAGGLLRTEAAMARVETSENLRGFARQGAKIGAGALLLAVTLVLLSVAGVVALSYWVGLLLALLLIAGPCGLLGMWLLRSGLGGLSDRRLLPERTLRRMSRDLDRLSAQADPLPEALKPEALKPEALKDVAEGKLHEAP